MRILNSSFTLKSLALAMGSAAFLISSAQSAVIWSDDFSGSARGATAPNSYDFLGGASGNDYNITGVTGGTYTVSGGPSGFLNIADTSTAGVTPVFTIFGNQFAPTSYAAGTQFTISYDLRVNSLVA